MSNTDFFVHESAYIEQGAEIGFESMIWHHCHVRSGASIGTNCTLGKNVFIDTSVRLGHRCKIQNNVSIYVGVSIADEVFVGPSATFTNDLVPRAFNTEWKVTETQVAHGASIGANSTIVCGVSLGEYCMVAAGATVTRDVEAHQLVAGTPARHLGWVCRCGTVVSRGVDRPEELECSGCLVREGSK